MKRTNLLLGLTVSILLSAAAYAQNTPTLTIKRSMTHTAKGTFEVKATPLPAERNVGDPLIGRLYLTKTFSGDIIGSSKGQMLGSQGESDKATGGYVAMERVTGTVNGKKGAFSLQHSGTMGGGKYEMNIIVVPGSGTGELAGIAGTFVIKIEGGKHFYDFTYTLPTK